MLSDSEWVVRTTHKILHFKNDQFLKEIEINDYGNIIDSFWGGDYAFCILRNRATLIGINKCYCWDLEDYTFNEYNIQNTLEKSPNHPNTSLHPFKASVNLENNSIWILLASQVLGDSALYAELSISNSIDFDWKAKHANHLTAKDYPRKIQHLTNSRYEAPDISDLCLLNDKRLCFTTGFHTAYGKYDMDYSILTEIDHNEKSIKQNVSIESCFGYFSSDKNTIIIKPLYKKGESKGKMFLRNLLTFEPEHLKFPRGTTQFRILDVFEGTVLLSNDSQGRYPAYSTKGEDNLQILKMKRC